MDVVPQAAECASVPDTEHTTPESEDWDTEEQPEDRTRLRSRQKTTPDVYLPSDGNTGISVSQSRGRHNPSPAGDVATSLGRMAIIQL